MKVYHALFSFFLKKLLVLCLVISSLSFNYAQELSYRKFTIEDGLPSNQVYDIHQDENGFLWFATENGLSRFDGENFKNYTIFDGLPDTEIIKFFKDSKGRTWLNTLNGKTGFYQNGKFHNSTNTSFLKDAFLDDLIIDSDEDKNGNIYFLSRKYLLQIKSNNEIIKKALPNNFYNLIKDINGTVFMINHITTTNDKITKAIDFSKVDIQLNQFDKKNLLRLVFKNYLTVSEILGWGKEISTQIEENEFSSFLENGNRTWLFGKNTPLQILDFQGKKLNNIYRAADPFYTRGFMDKDKNIWIGSGTGNGILMFNQSGAFVYKESTHLKGNVLNSFFVDKENDKIYCGTNDGMLNIISKDEIQTIEIPQRQTSIPRIRNIKKGPDGKIWLVCDGQVLTLENGVLTQKKRILGAPKSVFIKDKNVYLATATTAYFFNHDTEDIKKKSFFEKRSTSIHSDDQDNIWLGTPKGLLFFKQDSIHHSPKEFKFDDPISCINHIDDIILAGTKGKGIIVIKNGEVSRVTTEDGLASNLIRSIYIGEDKSIWVSTNQGISKLKSINTDTLNFNTITQQNGLISNDVLDCSIKNDTLFVLSPLGISKLNLSTLQSAFSPPLVKIEKILVNNQLWSKDSLLNLTHRQNNIGFSFSGIYFGNRKNLEYHYKLKGYHQKWLTTKSNDLLFEQLLPARYTLELYASQNGKRSNQLEVVTFEIVPAFYQRKMVQLLGILLLGFLIFYLIQGRIRRDQEKSTIENRLLQLEQVALQSQMNPHFIKNALGAIQHLMITKDIRSANKYLIVFGELITQLLKQADQSTIKISDEIKVLELYLSIEKLRFDNNFEYSITCDSDELMDKKIPSMMIQPLVENSIIHGFRGLGKNRKNKLTVQLSPQKNYVNCIVQDNGSGIDNSNLQSLVKKEGIALKNIKERISLLSIKKPKTSFEIVRTGTEGTVIKLLLPIKEYHD